MDTRTHLRQLWKASTPGVWRKHDFGNAGGQEPSSIIIFEGEFYWTSLLYGEQPIIASLAWDSQEDSDAQFIVAAHNRLPELLDTLDAVERLHEAYKVYDECECPEEAKSDETTHVDILEIGRTCNVRYVACRECCAVDGYQTEECAYHHRHDMNPDHRCSTIQVLRGEK